MIRLITIYVLLFTHFLHAQFFISSIREPAVSAPVSGIATTGNAIFAVGSTNYQSYLARSTDSGLHWHNYSEFIPSGAALKSIYFPTEMIGYAGGKVGAMFKTTNAGLEWTRIDDSTRYRGNVSNLYFVSADTGYLCGSVYNGASVFRTTNGGATWQALPANITRSMHAMHWDDVNHGWAVGEAAKIMRTENGGASWQISSQGSSDLNSVFRASATTLYAGGNNLLLKSTDGGETFTVISSPQNFTIYAMHFTDSLTGYIAGSGGKVYRTANGGADWQQMAMKTSSDITEIKQRGGDLLWGTQYGGVYSSGSNFSNWTVLSNDYRTYHGVTCHAKDITIAGEGGEMYMLQQGEARWQLLPHVPTTATLRATARHGETIITCGADGMVHRSSDNGGSWSSQSLFPSSTLVMALGFADAQHVYAAGLYGSVYLSTDAGVTWQLRNTIPVTELYNLEMRADSFGVAVCSDDRIYVTTNMGVSWSAMTGIKPTEKMYAVRLLSRQTGFVAGENGTVYKSSNGFQSVTMVSDTSGMFGTTLYAVAALNDSMVWAGGKFGIILQMQANRRMQRFDSTGHDIRAMAVYDNFSVVTAGSGGRVYRVGMRVIPVVFQMVQAKRIGEYLHLKWRMADELGCRGYGLQFSADGVLWKDVGDDIPRSVVSGKPYEYTRRMQGNAYNFCRITAMMYNGNREISVPIPIDNADESGFEVAGVYPNPANPTSNLAFTLSQRAQVKITVYDVCGSEVLQMDLGMLDAGKHKQLLPFHGLSSGVYYYRLHAGRHSASGKVVVLR